MSNWAKDPWNNPKKQTMAQKLKMSGPSGMRNTGAKFPKAPKAQMLPNVNVAGLPNPQVKHITTGGKSGAIAHPSHVLVQPQTPIKGKQSKGKTSALSQSYVAPTTAIQQPMFTVPSAPAQQQLVAQQQGSVAQPQAPPPPPTKAQIMLLASQNATAAYNARKAALSASVAYKQDPHYLVQSMDAATANVPGYLNAPKATLWQSWLQSKRRRDAYNSIGLKRDQVINQRFVDAARQMPERRAARKSAIWARKQRFRRAMGWGRPELGVLPSRTMGYVV